MPLSVETVLVPVDGSEASTDAAEYAVAIADAYDAEVHVLYVLGESVTRGLETGDVGSEAVAEDHATFLADLEEMGGAQGVPVTASTVAGFSTTRKTQHPGSVILDVAADIDADFLVIPQETDRPTPGVLEKAAEYVLLYASQPVLSV
ncbi:MAG: universal stress protein [Halobacteriaceae archaeon]